jgi:hypothetical protein
MVCKSMSNSLPCEDHAVRKALFQHNINNLLTMHGCHGHVYSDRYATTVTVTSSRCVVRSYRVASNLQVINPHSV